jgi:hypothetical protein
MLKKKKKNQSLVLEAHLVILRGKVQVILLGLCLKNCLGIQNNMKSESPSPKLGPIFWENDTKPNKTLIGSKVQTQGLRPTWLQLNWSPSSSLEAHMTFLELKSDLAWIKAQPQDLRFTSLCLNWSPSLRFKAHLIFPEWVKVQTQGLKFTWPLFLNQSPSSALEALMTWLESRPKSNIWDPNNFNKFKTQVQRLEPI